ncbi:MAG: uroporphyrinogen decarboxylase family protein [Candidatus Latescibacterota bacterium]
MNHVERFRAIMNYEDVDRLPVWEWAMWWDKTIERWHGEGLPEGLDDVFEISQYFGHDPYKQFWFSTTQATIEAVQHHVEGIVTNMDDYSHHCKHLYPDHSASIEDMAPWFARQKNGEAVIWITIEGFFWFPRTMMGFVKLMLAYYDQPELIHRINSDLLDFNLRLLEKIAKIGLPTFMTVAEDMSYNHGPMISREMCDEFLSPYYRRLLSRAKEMGMKTIVDTDGDVTKLIPWMESVGIDGVLPIERQSGADGMSIRKQFPKFCLIGHFDKMVMTRGESAMRAEFERILPLMKTGGFIPSVDHQTPPSVSMEEYRVYLKLLREYVEK